MNPPFEWAIRDATPDDADAIAALIRTCWPHDTPDPERIARLIGNGHRTLCAWAGSVCVGLVDAFTTPDPFGQSRWEVDLLAVAGAARGQGIGKRLVSESAEAAPLATRYARGLVRVGNTPAERSFAAAGFRADPVTRTLYVAGPMEALDPTGALGLAVYTLTYSGLWLESRPDSVDLAAARGRVAELGLEQVGTFAVDPAEAALCHTAGYEPVGVFRWWVQTR